MLQSAHRPLARRRGAFTLLEVLVVVAILVVLASVAGVYAFKYLEDSKIDAARSQMTIFENAAKNHATQNEGVAPPSLEYLVAPTDGTKPRVDGGIMTIKCPVDGGTYNYDGAHVDQYGSPDPQVTMTTPDGKTWYSTARRGAR